MSTRHNELLLAAATAELGEDAGLGAVTKRAALYAMAPTLLAVLQEWHGTPHNLHKDCEICQVIAKAAWQEDEMTEHTPGPHPIIAHADDILWAAAETALGKGADLKTVDKLAATYAAAPELLVALAKLQEWFQWNAAAVTRKNDINLQEGSPCDPEEVIRAAIAAATK